MQFANCIWEMQKQAVSDSGSPAEKIPGYLPAQFMLTAAYCCDGQKEKGMRGFEKLRKTHTGPISPFPAMNLQKALFRQRI
jgi:hypothetical protein